MNKNLFGTTVRFPNPKQSKSKSNMVTPGPS